MTQYRRNRQSMAQLSAAAFLEKQSWTALFQTRSRHVGEAAQLTMENPVRHCNSEGIFGSSCSAGSHHPGSLEKQNATAYLLRHRLWLWIIIRRYYTAKKPYCQYLFLKKRGKEDIIERNIINRDIIKADIIFCMKCSFGIFWLYKFSFRLISFPQRPIR